MSKVSVVVPVYKVERYIRPCIESILGQTMEDLQLILVDDGSPDDCGRICDEYAARDSRVQVIHKTNGGVSAARNDGLAAATGEWVIFCDSDDWLETDALEQMVQLGEQEEADLVIGDIYQVKGEEREPWVYYRNGFATSDRAVIEKMVAANFCRNYCFDPPETGHAYGYGGPWNKLVRRRLLEEAHIRFDLRVKGIYDDVIYSANILAASRKVAYGHIWVYDYRILTGSITHTYKPEMLLINEAIFQAWEEFLEKYGYGESLRGPYYANVIRRLESALEMYFFSKANQEKLRRRLRLLRKTIRTEPYRSAIRYGDPDKQSCGYSRALHRCARLGSAWLLWCLHHLNIMKARLNKLRGK